MQKRNEERLKQVERDLNTKIEELIKKLKLLEKHDRKYNLLFFGFREEAREYVFDVLRESFVNHLDLDEERVRDMYFVNGHRIPSKSPGQKPIILRFTSFEDRELILSQASKYVGSRRRVLVDLPEDMKKERDRLAKKAFEIRKNEKKHTRIRGKGLNVWLEVRNDGHDQWVKRDV